MEPTSILGERGGPFEEEIVIQSEKIKGTACG
jgi:hypothetical protein